MALDPKTVEALQRHVNEKWRNKACHFCHTHNWTAIGYVTLGLSDIPTVMAVGGPSLPCAALICQNCGNTVFINLAVAKLVGPPNG